jgi:hypothetical protein
MPWLKRKYSGSQNERDIGVQSKWKLISVIDDKQRKEKNKKESLCD